MKKEQIEDIYQGTEIIYEEPDVEHRDGISTLQSQLSQSRVFTKQNTLRPGQLEDQSLSPCTTSPAACSRSQSRQTVTRPG